ncbi:MAG: L,D-transpeptidase [Cyclobacteriaceae bacterium]|nr:L,D-transpeptidase [Cyclobacteriaceae bacterium]
MRRILTYTFITLILMSCRQQQNTITLSDTVSDKIEADSSLVKKNTRAHVIVPYNVKVKDYLNFIDSVCAQIPILSDNKLGSYILVHYNPWLIDSLRNLDYYFQKAKGKFQYDLNIEIILQKGDSLFIPDSLSANAIANQLLSSRIDVNIPEYQLRVIQQTDTVLNFKVRVGQNSKEYMEALGDTLNQRTPIGNGKIINVIKAPVFINFKTGERYVETRRDDGYYTRMPLIPSLEPVINGLRYGKMFHATTNLMTLGKAYSNGCIGMREADAWSLYYYAPIGTPLKIRYDLIIINNKKEKMKLRDIYHLYDQPKQEILR